jgi:hypothetical protein
MNCIEIIVRTRLTVLRGSQDATRADVPDSTEQAAAEMIARGVLRSSAVHA